MDLPLLGVPRQEAIAQRRQDILDQTMITFLPRCQTHFMDDYENLPGHPRMATRDRIKLIPDDYRRKFLRRVEIVVQHCLQAIDDEASEFSWEADAWRDIFGRLRDDERLRMDKREYNYKATLLPDTSVRAKDGYDSYMGKRIPDITFGLSSYLSGNPDDEGIDERERKIRRCLHERALSLSTVRFYSPALMFDGKWGETTILFPFAVYEAKKNEKTDTAVKIQLKLALNAYLKMLDELIHQPEPWKENEECQPPRSTAFPVFGFTSGGSLWKLYVGYLPNCLKADDPFEEEDPLCDTNSHMKLIWWGDLRLRENAGELLDIVDQIHEYAVTTHRPLVAQHLGRWVTSQQIYRELCTSGALERSSLFPTHYDLLRIKFHSPEVRKLIGKKRKRDSVFTDDDAYRAGLEARLKSWERETCAQKKTVAGLQQQSLRRSGRIKRMKSGSSL
ncbi:hypothetical protein BJY00DRAFT_254501 [Aspergillus carlsbadensis]|nr:hypothetical protein BJY00DRAFT_254501 [Aspergillus carlsbadensis]